MMKIFFLFISMNFLTKLVNTYMYNLFFFMMMMIMIYLLFNNLSNFYWLNINFSFGLDNLSLSMMLLTILIMSLSMYSYSIISNKYFLNFMNLIIILSNMLIMCFCSMNLMNFYIMFETSLIPIIIIIMGWGTQIDRIQASMYMLFYTLFGSLPLLIMILMIFLNKSTIMMNMLSMKQTLNFNHSLMYFMMSLGFLIKMPMYLTHLWLPKAHVEAPVSGSMILAGIMLKLGSYGILRSMMILMKLFIKMNYFMLMFSLIGSMFSSLICLNQMDYKIIVAYSSIVHMGVMMSSMMTMFILSMNGSILLMISHGLCSCGMFFIVNLSYERMMSRNMIIFKGMINIFPSLTLWWFLICSSNFSAPPSLNLISEIMLFNSLIQWNMMVMSFIMFISFFSTCYSIMLFAYSQYNKIFLSFFNFMNIKQMEFLILIMFWIPLNLLFLNMNFLI